MHKDIVLLDDNIMIRQSLINLFSLYGKKTGIDVKIYSSENGVEGLGYIFLAQPDQVIIDTTLPKYSGRELIEFLLSQRKIPFTEIVAIDDGNKIYKTLLNTDLEFTKDIGVINKKDPEFLSKLINRFHQNLFKNSEFPKEIKNSYLFKLTNKFIFWGNIIDNINITLESSTFFKKLGLRFIWVLIEIWASVLSSIMLILYGKAEDQNLEQTKIDLREYRVKYYPTIVGTLSALIIFGIQLALLSVGGVIIGNLKIESILAVGNGEITFELENSTIDSYMTYSGSYYFEGNEENKVSTIILNDPIEYDSISNIKENSSQNTNLSSIEDPILGFTLGYYPENGITYQLSQDGDVWLFYDGEKWRPTNLEWETSNTIQEINSYLYKFPKDRNTLYLKAYLHSSGEKVTLNSLSADVNLNLIEKIEEKVFTPDVEVELKKEIEIGLGLIFSEIYPEINDASYMEEFETISGEIIVPDGLDLRPDQIDNLKVKAYYTSSTDGSKNAKDKIKYIGISDVKSYPLEGDKKYKYNIPVAKGISGYITTEIIWIDNNGKINLSELSNPKKLKSINLIESKNPELLPISEEDKEFFEGEILAEKNTTYKLRVFQDSINDFGISSEILLKSLDLRTDEDGRSNFSIYLPEKDKNSHQIFVLSECEDTQGHGICKD